MSSQPSFCLLITQISGSGMPKATTKYLQISVGKKERNGRASEETCKLLSLVNKWLVGQAARCSCVRFMYAPTPGLLGGLSDKGDETGAWG